MTWIGATTCSELFKNNSMWCFVRCHNRDMFFPYVNLIFVQISYDEYLLPKLTCWRLSVFACLPQKHWSTSYSALLSQFSLQLSYHRSRRYHHHFLKKNFFFFNWMHARNIWHPDRHYRHYHHYCHFHNYFHFTHEKRFLIINYMYHEFLQKLN